MTKEEWLQLLPGDIIIEVSSGAERRVISVSRYKPKNSRHIRTSITLKKLYKRLWTPSRTTTYNNHDDRGRWILKRR